MAAEFTATRKPLDELLREVRVSITQIGPHRWRASIGAGFYSDLYWSRSRRGIDSKVKRALEREAKKRAWEDASITWVVWPT